MRIINFSSYLCSMIPERIKLFLHYFYAQYVENCYKGTEVVLADGSTFDMGQFNVPQYMVNHLDIYIEHCNYEKEYSLLYNPSLFYSSRKKEPEEFNQLHIYMIDNIQLFFHTILDSVISKTLLKENKIKALKLQFRLIDNEEVKLMDLVNAAEKKMIAQGIEPPSKG